MEEALESLHVPGGDLVKAPDRTGIGKHKSEHASRVLHGQRNASISCFGCEAVYHLAAVISIDGDKGGLVPRINVGGAGNVAEAARTLQTDRGNLYRRLKRLGIDPSALNTTS